ncbi:uncharacterized protein LOC107041299 [Diachasma alloeum]|uniref:uncharacterized protein LOC107041299 n=1 Tax=Diachasma alloeum TaxID=454923 RepID=UPI00073816E1|nr:uncharacterized protein LOC107041299 [Diachasma alloeum]
MADVLKDDSEVVSKIPEVEMEIKDLDEITTKEEIWEAIQKQDGINFNISMSAIKTLRKAYGGTQRAIFRVTTDVASKLEEKGKIRIGWVNCRISATNRPIKCLKCWRYGHLATQCKREVDRSKLCFRYADLGYKIAKCRKEPRCTLCDEKGGVENGAHIAGSSRCPAYTEAIQKLTSRRQ